MNSRIRTAGFTAIELAMVMGIMLIIMAVAVPSVLPMLRKGKVATAADQILACWREARSLAMTSSIPSGVNPCHFGIWINQPASGAASVTLICDNVTTSPRPLVFSEDPTNVAGTYVAGGQPVMSYTFNQNVLVATSTSTTGTPTANAASVVLYVQYGTGLPLDPADVAASRGLVAAPSSMGISGMFAQNMGVSQPNPAPYSVMPIVELQTVDYQNSPRVGYAMAIAVFNAGFVTAEDL